MKINFQIKSFTLFCVFLFFSTYGCFIEKDKIVSIEIYLIDNNDGGTNIDIYIDCIKNKGTILTTVNGLAPEFFENIKPKELSKNSVDYIENYVKIDELDKLDSAYTNQNSDGLNSRIIVNTVKKKYEIKVIGGTKNEYLRELHKIAFGLEF